MTVEDGTRCAACEYQGGDCTSDCPLAPYFPPDQPKQFQNAHRLFGMNNILKILKKLDPNQKLVAMRSILYQANIREKYPVHGCLGIIYYLQLRIHQTQTELDAVNAQLAIFRQHHHNQISSPPLPSSQPQLAPIATPSANNALTLFHNNNHQQFNAVDSGISVATPHHQFPITTNNSPTIQSQFITAQPPVVTQGFDEMSTFLDVKTVDSKEPYESSSESSMKDTTQSMEHVEEKNLKSTPSCLQITSQLMSIQLD